MNTMFQVADPQSRSKVISETHYAFMMPSTEYSPCIPDWWREQVCEATRPNEKKIKGSTWKEYKLPTPTSRMMGLLGMVVGALMWVFSTGVLAQVLAFVIILCALGTATGSVNKSSSVAAEGPEQTSPQHSNEVKAPVVKQTGITRRPNSRKRSNNRMTNLQQAVQLWLEMDEQERREFRKLISDVEPEETLNYQAAYRAANEITKVTYPQLTRALMKGEVMALTPSGGGDTKGYGRFVKGGQLKEGEEETWQVNRMSLLAYAFSLNR
jgi:hypothetical protein